MQRTTCTPDTQAAGHKAAECSLEQRSEGEGSTVFQGGTDGLQSDQQPLLVHPHGKAIAVEGQGQDRPGDASTVPSQEGMA